MVLTRHSEHEWRLDDQLGGTELKPHLRANSYEREHWVKDSERTTPIGALAYLATWERHPYSLPVCARREPLGKYLRRHPGARQCP